jgi:hypothetical protein
MRALRRALPVLALAGLAWLGWAAMVPVWSEGLSGVAFNAGGQPALWSWGVIVCMVFGGSALAGNLAEWDDGFASGMVSVSRGLGVGFISASIVLYLAMAGQPLKAWFLFEGALLGHQVQWIALACMVSLLVLIMPLPGTRWLRRLFAALWAGGYFGYIWQFSPILLIMAVSGGYCLLIFVTPGAWSMQERTKRLKYAGYGFAFLAAMAWDAPAELVALGTAAAAALWGAYGKHESASLTWIEALFCAGMLAALTATARPDFLAASVKDWLVLAFAAACGLSAGHWRWRSLAKYAAA